MGADREDSAGPLDDLVEKALKSLHRNGVDSAEVSRFLRDTTETCTLLQDQIEAHTVAKVGLEAILSAYDSRFGDLADQNNDVALFKRILSEKEELLADLEKGVRDQAKQVNIFLKAMDKRRAELERDLSRFESAFEQIRRTHQEVRRRMEADRAKVEAVRERHWPDGESGPASPEEKVLPQETLHRIVDDALERVAPDSKVRSELIEQVLGSIKDEEIKAVLSQKTAPSLDDLPEVSDDEFWDG